LVDVFSLALLSVEIILLLLTLLLLMYSHRERNQRKILFNLLIDTVKVLTREEYFNIVVEELDNAKRSVWGAPFDPLERYWTADSLPASENTPAKKPPR